MKVALISVIATAALFQDGQAVIQSKCTRRGLYAMTWDDGPAQYTQSLLNTLSSKGVRATFHLTTQFLTDPSVQSMIQKISAAGHLIGLRSEPNWNLREMSNDQIRASIARSANVMASFIGYYPKFVRLPYNGYDDRVLKAVESTGAIVTTHNLETYDYSNDANRVLNAVKLSLSLVGKGQGAFISIQHDGVQQSVAVADRVIDQIKSSGYKLVTLDECLGLSDMTKNKTPLEGADSEVDLDEMEGGISPGLDGGAGSVDLDDPVSGQSSSRKNAASVAQMTAAAIFASLFAVLFQQL